MPPPRPAYEPGSPARSDTALWLDHPRPESAPLGAWRYGYAEPPPDEETARSATRGLLTGMVISLVVGALVWSLWRNGYVPYQWVLLKAVTPNGWWWPATTSPKTPQGTYALIVYQGVAFGVVVTVFGKLGHWPQAIRQFVGERPAPVRLAVTLIAAALAELLVWQEAVPVASPILALIALVAGGGQIYQSELLTYLLYALIAAAVAWPFARVGRWREGLRRTAGSAPPPPVAPAPLSRPSEWPDLRAAGLSDAAERLAVELRAERMADVDCARIRGRWDQVQTAPTGMTEFADTVLRDGGRAWLHPSGQRDLPERAAVHDVLTGQVRIGTGATTERTPHPYRGAGIALEPAVLATSLLAVGSPGAGKTRHLVQPIVESLGLRALTGQCAVVAVCAAGTPLGPDDAFDVVVRIGDPHSLYDFDLFAGTTDPDEAASFLAEGLVGDLSGVDTRSAATALAQVLGPFRAAYERWPTVPELAELLHGEPAALQALRTVLQEAGNEVMVRELDARIRAVGGADPGRALADRLALLDRPAFADFFGAGPRAARTFFLGAMAGHPLRVRIDLPEQRHEDASRLLTRLLLAQFTGLAAGRSTGHHSPSQPFLCLVLDDAAQALTPGTVRGIQRLRSRHAGVVLTLRTMADVPDSLHGALQGAVGCRMAFSGITTWDGRRFAEAWGTHTVEVTEVAKHTVYADQPTARAIHALRKMVTGRDVTTDAVTVRKVERDHWSASELANELPPGHAVLSLTAANGESAPPLLLDLWS